MAIRFQYPYEVMPPVDHVDLLDHASVRIRHPGYPDANNELLRLVATDCTGCGAGDGDGEAEDRRVEQERGKVYGIQFHVVHAACAIITGNRFDGILSRRRVFDPSANPDVPSEPAALLPAGDYYFHVPDARSDTHATNTTPTPDLNPYPVVPNFRSWPFPVDQFSVTSALTGWTSTSIARTSVGDQPARERDVSCRLTNQRECVQLAHIVPEAEASWFMHNTLDRISAREGKDAILKGNENLILLRADVHTIWDRSDFSFVPKLDTTLGWKWAVHVHKPSSELHYLYHNRPLQPLKNIRSELLFARFAYDLFPKLRGFLQRGASRCVLLSGATKQADAEECERFCESQGRHRSTSARKSKSGSPTKRARTEVDEQNEREERRADGEDSEIGDSGVSLQEDGDSQDDDQSDDPYGYKRRAEQADLEEQMNRGRKRKRFDEDEAADGHLERRRSRVNEVAPH